MTVQMVGIGESPVGSFRINLLMATIRPPLIPRNQKKDRGVPQMEEILIRFIYTPSRYNMDPPGWKT
jgi:hypothetical protein